MNAPSTDSPPATPVLAENQELRCRACGWELSDVSPQAVCPNCGRSAIASTNGELLRFSLPPFVLSLAVATRLICFGTLLTGVIPFVAVFAAWFTIGQPVSKFFTMEPALFWIASICIFLGWWLLTRPEANGMGEKNYGIWRKAVRLVTLVGFIRFAASELRRPLRDSAILMPILNRITELSRWRSLWYAEAVVAVIVQLLQLERLINRIPDDRLARNVRFYKRILPAIDALVLVCETMVQTGKHPPKTSVIASTVKGIVSIGAVPFFVGYLMFIWRLGTRLKQERQLAKAVWPT